MSHGDGTNAFVWLFMCLQSIYISVELTEMPVFEPNEYFWQNHLQPGEEKWQAYARVVRDIMADQGGLEKLETTMEDKFEYKALFKGKKPRAAKVAADKPTDGEAAPVMKPVNSS